MTLIERDRELGTVAELLTGAKDGRGATLLVEGPPGIGKTALLAAARTYADAQRFHTLTAVGGELDQELPFAIVRQLLEPPPLTASADTRADLLAGAAGLAAPVFGLDLDRMVGADATGTATFTDTPPTSGPYEYVVRFLGDGAYGPAEARTTVQVEKLPTSLSVGFEPGRPKRGTLPGTVVVTLGPTVGHRAVSVSATTAAGTTLLTYQSVPFDGPLRVPYTVTTTTTFTATYDGNDWQQPATASTTVQPPERKATG